MAAHNAGNVGNAVQDTLVHEDAAPDLYKVPRQGAEWRTGP